MNLRHLIFIHFQEIAASYQWMKSCVVMGSNTHVYAYFQRRQIQTEKREHSQSRDKTPTKSCEGVCVEPGVVRRSLAMVARPSTNWPPVADDSTCCTTIESRRDMWTGSRCDVANRRHSYRHIITISVCKDMQMRKTNTLTQNPISNMKTGHIYWANFRIRLGPSSGTANTEIIDQFNWFIYKVRPHIHLSLNKHGRLNLRQTTNLNAKEQRSKLLFKAKINCWVRMLLLGLTN
jgi:hypothetical protein